MTNKDFTVFVWEKSHLKLLCLDLVYFNDKYLKTMTHSLQQTLFRHLTKQRASPNGTSTARLHFVMEGLTHPIYKPLCLCLTHSAGKFNFPSLEMGLPNRIISSPIYYHLILEISVLAWCFFQTNRQNWADMRYKLLIICSPADSFFVKIGLSLCFLIAVKYFDSFQWQFSTNESVIRKLFLRFWMK